MTATPAKPGAFAPDGLPPNTVWMRVPFWQDRALQIPRITLVHTNGADLTATNQSSFNWATAKPEKNTLPHYQVQLDGQAAKYIPTDRRGLDNGTVAVDSDDFPNLTNAQQAEIVAHGQVRNWSIGIETSDLGYGPGKPGDDSGFTDEQIETLAGILAYESILWGIPLAYPETWWGTGTACHTENFEFPFWTLFRGKSCPGTKKKLLMVARVLPRAAEIKAAWTGGEHTDIKTDTDSDEENDMPKPELVGFFNCPAAGGAVCAVYRGGYKVHQDGPVLAAAQALARLDGLDDAVHPIDDVSMWQALGPLLIPVAGLDTYGSKAA
jgi:N-acetylmuramoyl-L-alanine amidase